MFWSIISDYGLETGICELIDNAIDLWMSGDRKGVLKVEIDLDVDRQLISVVDNAGGLSQEDLRLLVAPGGSKIDPNAELIGVFGVGSKRAGIALGEHVVISTRASKGRSFELDITKQWLESEDWQLPAYEIPDIDPGTTRVAVSHLRTPLSREGVQDLFVHLGEVYEWFLGQGCIIELNDVSVEPQNFELWAYPPGFGPRLATFDLPLGKNEKLSVEITAGLIRDRDPELDNYGVYFYCNHRLVVKELKAREVGYFVTSEAGVPHPDASLCRAIVRLQGPAKLMPWNSSKSGINYSHPAFHQLRPTLIKLVSHFSSLSRRLKDDWDAKVFRHEAGTIEKVDPADVASGKRLVLPPLPRVNRAQSDQLKTKNKSQIQSKPWTLGLVEAIAAVDIISRQRLETKNRIALVLLDSNFEIALKEFIVHRLDLFPPDKFGDAAIAKLFKNRDDVIAAVAQKVSIPMPLLDTARHYYLMRNKLIHERATVGILDSDVNNYRLTIEKILELLFDLQFQ